MNKKDNIWITLRRFAGNAIIVISAPVVGVVALIAISLWFLQFLGDPKQTASYASGSPFTLAQVMAIFGAFGIAGGFSKYGNTDMRSSLRLVGVLYILSALGFSLLGMMMPILPSTDEGTSSRMYLEWGISGAYTVAAVTFCWGTLMLLFSIGTLLTWDDEDDQHRDINPTLRHSGPEPESIPGHCRQTPGWFARITARLPMGPKQDVQEKRPEASASKTSAYVQTAKGILLWTIPLFLLAFIFWLMDDTDSYWHMFSAIVVFAALMASALLNWLLHKEREKHDVEVQRLLREISRKL